MKKRAIATAVSVFISVILFSLLSISDAFAYSASVDKTSLTQGECLTLTWSGFGDTTNIIVYKGTVPWIYANTQAPYQGTQQICTGGWEIRNDYKIRVEQKSNTSIYVYTQTFAVLGPKPYLLDFLINGGASSVATQAVVLQFNFTTSNPTYYMASESSSFYGASWIAYTGLKTVNFMLSAGAGTKFVYFKLKNAYGESSVKWDNISYEPILYYNISGYVKDGNGLGIDGVTINGFSSGSATTDVSGYYIYRDIISTWTGTITPSKTGYTFSPTSKTYSGLTGDMTNQNFTAIPDVTYSWQTGEWSACNDTCCGGTKTRTVQCIESAGGEAVSESYCTDAKPDSISYDCPVLAPSPLVNDKGGVIYEE